LGHLDFEIVSNFDIRISDLASLGIFTLVKNPLQIAPFMQNKPNFLDTQMNVKSFHTVDYENIANWTLGENKPNTKPIKPNTKPIKANKMPKQTQFLSYPNPPDCLSQPSAAPRSQ
jgi:hypothetical protein